ncbi:MAG TPA: cation diffusion facilitator family transporter [Rhodothermales bacterium]|nr:cation-efflux pump [Bacteroidota bacterium]HRK73363.1 cation diffusion facilitator family transporter [Rhodothermales bacterium]HRR08791.1 cation diffusion facilitator family transporter [Rhodothermales bacterium]
MATTTLTRYAWWSLGVAVLTILLKLTAYFMTGSVGLLSDALESVVNILGAVLALWMIALAAKPPDEDHAYGHFKAEYFSSGAEGLLIIGAALSILWESVNRLVYPYPIQSIPVGLLISGVATILNLAMGLWLIRVGRLNESVSLQANGKHLLTDVWTTVGVIVGLLAIQLTGQVWWDPVLGLIMALHILWTGYQLARGAALGLMDTALPEAERKAVCDILERYKNEGAQYHALRTRQSGVRRFVSVHVLVPGDWTVHRGHQLLEHIEADIRNMLGTVTVFTHLESLEDESSWHDQELDRTF